jgi:hypothetical protein
MEKPMKAVLEFNYPEDEHKLEHALKGTAYHEALVSIDTILTAPFTKAEAHSRVRKIIAQVLGEAP